MASSHIQNNMSHYLVKYGYYLLVSSVMLMLLYCIYLLFFPLLGSVLLTFILEPIVNYFETKGYRRLWVILGISLAVVLVFAAGIWLVVPRIIAESQNIMAGLPEYTETIKTTIGSLQETLQKRFPQFEIPDLYQHIASRFSGSGLDTTMVVDKITGLFSILSVVAIIPIISFFLLVDGHLIHKAIMKVIPNRYFEMSILLIYKTVTALKLFLRGQLIDASAVGVLTSIGLLIIGLPYAIVIGIIAGLGNLIPYLGPIIGFVPALMVVVMSPEGLTVMRLVAVVVVFAMVQFIEGTFVYPIAVGKSVDLHPLVVIIGITIGGQLGGIVGMILVIPIISIVKVSLEVLHTYLKAYTII